MKKLILIVFITFSVISCARNIKKTDTPPNWITQKTHSRYPQPFYLLGIGVSKINVQAADDNARMDIAKQIKVHITGVDKSLISEINKLENDKLTAQSTIAASSGVENKVDVSLVGVSLPEHWYDKKENIFYSLAVLDKEKLSKNYSKEEGIKILINDILSQIKEKEIEIAIIEPVNKNFSLRSEIENALKQNEGIKIHLIERDMTVLERVLMLESININTVSFYLTVAYGLEDNGIQVKANLLNPKTQEIIANAKVIVSNEVGQSIEPDKITGSINQNEGLINQAPIFISSDEENILRKLIKMKPLNQGFNIKIWTDKKDYEIGEVVTFYIRSEEDCYLTLIDIGTSGRLTILYPNQIETNNFIKKDKVYSISAESYGIKIKVDGPSGINRIKAIATKEPGSLLNTSRIGYSVDITDKEKSRDLNLALDNFSPTNWSEAYWDINIYNPNETDRGLKKKKPRNPINIMGTQGVKEEREIDVTR